MAPVPSNAKTAFSASGGPDTRVNAWRPDIADIALKGVVDAARFVHPAPHRLTADAPHMLRLGPDRAAVAVSELLPGERFDVLYVDGGWAWGFSAHDHYTGYLEADVLAEGAPGATHTVIVPTALAFSRPDIKSEVLYTLPMHALLSADDFDERFVRTSHGVFVHRRHVGTPGPFASDHVEVATQFLGTPYKWGGRTQRGIDCSGLVQVALNACGIAAPRDTDLQAAALGSPVGDGDFRRGDLIFFPGHVGIMADAERLVHANAFHMVTVVEPLADVVGRLRPQYDAPITAIRRL